MTQESKNRAIADNMRRAEYIKMTGRQSNPDWQQDHMSDAMRYGIQKEIDARRIFNDFAPKIANHDFPQRVNYGIDFGKGKDQSVISVGGRDSGKSYYRELAEAYNCPSWNSFYEEFVKGNWKTSNQLNLNKMSNLSKEQKEKVDRTNLLANQISDLKFNIEKVKDSTKLGDNGLTRGSLYFSFEGRGFEISNKYINFKSLQTQILAAMNKELKALEKEFNEI